MAAQAGQAAAAGPIDMRRVEVVAPNLKRRLSGVTSTIVQLVPLQARELAIVTFGPGLPADLPRMRWWQLPALLARPERKPFRIWHARRNTEMVAGLVLRDVFRAPLRLLFTSAAQRRHKPFTRWLIRRMDAVVATSARSGSFLQVPHRVIMHGVDTKLFHPPRDPEDIWAATGLPGQYGIGCFGRIRHQKGTDLFIDAMIELLPRYPDWTAVILGRATAEHHAFAEDLKHRVHKAGLSQRIRFLGEVPDVRPWYRRLSLYVAPSRNEGFGLTPLEAMASGAAVVASDAGAYAELIVPEQTGMVVPAGDGAALSAAIEPYLADPALAARQGEAGRAHVAGRFALAGEAAALREVYEDLWERGR
ncbi:glycosyltransferase family 4 protein [Chelativorans sp. AA-79]|uniref:glycosyltransferase family 4 protein n=1 Tax=Chelativorans sp. AA-79 TaxID=3028735 RepID=UPI0023F972B5|nr:glycosyltransferase family 4 protein [Chelativorans sp. AA-79]WEX11189.1 glycosyltransferase family 4 protein [Chelativorans sp. AA-79]